MQNNVHKLHEVDARYEQLLGALSDVLYERGEGVPVASVVGLLEILKMKVLKDNIDAL